MKEPYQPSSKFPLPYLEASDCYLNSAQPTIALTKPPTAAKTTEPEKGNFEIYKTYKFKHEIIIFSNLECPRHVLNRYPQLL